MATLTPSGRPLVSQGQPLLSQGRVLGPPTIDTDAPSSLLNGIEGMTNANTARIRAAIQRVIDGEGNATIAEIGDSTTAGATGVSPSRYNGRVAQVADLIATRFGVPVGTKNAVGSASHTVTGDYANYNPIISFSGATINASERHPGGFPFQSTLFGSEWRITPGFSFDRVRLYARGSASSLIGWRDSTGAQGSVGVTGNSLPYHIDISVTDGSTWVEFFLWSGGTVRWCGAHCYNSDTPEIILLNAGWSGSDSVDWTESGLPTIPYQVFDQLTNLAADLYVINICLNDQGVQSPATYKTNLLAIINRCKEQGDVLVMCGNQRDTALVDFATAEAIRVAAQEAAAETNVPYWHSDEVLGDYATANANGDMVDQTHANIQGCGKLATAQDAGFYAQLQARM